MQRRLTLAAVVLTMLSFVALGYLYWPQIQVRWWCRQLGKCNGITRSMILRRLHEHPKGLYDLSMDSFCSLIQPVPIRGSQMRIPAKPGTYAALDFDRSFFSMKCWEHAVFVNDAFVGFGSSGTVWGRVEKSRALLEKESVVEDWVLLDCEPNDFRLQRDQVTPLMPSLIGYLRRCPDRRSRWLCCYVLHVITQQDLPPTTEAWTTWWEKHQAEIAQPSHAP